MTHHYKTRGVCSRRITFDLEDGRIRNVEFEGGCSGNTQGISKLVEDLPAEEVLKRLSGIRCGLKSTSCPDQLAKAVAAAVGQEKKESWRKTDEN